MINKFLYALFGRSMEQKSQEDLFRCQLKNLGLDPDDIRLRRAINHLSFSLLAAGVDPHSNDEVITLVQTALSADFKRCRGGMYGAVRTDVITQAEKIAKEMEEIK